MTESGHEATAAAGPQKEGRHDHGGGLRRRAAYFYGLMVCGAVLAAEPENISAWLVGIALMTTVVVYWVAETFAHWVAARSTRGRKLTKRESWDTAADGLPLVWAGFVPALVVFLEAVAGVATTTAVQVALLVNIVLLGLVGWIMCPADRSVSPRRLGYAAVTVLLGVAMIGLKDAVHH